MQPQTSCLCGCAAYTLPFYSAGCPTRTTATTTLLSIVVGTWGLIGARAFRTLSGWAAHTDLGPRIKMIYVIALLAAVAIGVIGNMLLLFTLPGM